MTSPNHPRFRLLVGWCCLMTSALLIVTVYLAIEKSRATENKSNSSENGITDRLKGSSYGLSFNGYIRFIRDKTKWICEPPADSCNKSSFLPLHNDTVNITISGLYYIHAQVTFLKSTIKNKETNVHLIRNGGHGIRERKLSEVIGYEPGSLTLIRMVELKEGERISLKIKSEFQISGNDDHTYWEILKV